MGLETDRALEIKLAVRDETAEGREFAQARGFVGHPCMLDPGPAAARLDQHP